jgi:hypothetical protein
MAGKFAVQMALAELRKLPRTVQEAQAKKSSHYFTGVKCPNGHLDRRSTSSRGCLSCMRERAARKYAADPETARANAKKHRSTPKAKKTKAKYDSQEHIRAKQRQYSNNYRKNNPEKVKAATKKWKQENAERVEQYMEEYREENKDRILPQARKRAREYYRENRKDILETSRIRTLTDEEFAEANRQRASKRRKTNPEAIRIENRNLKARKKNTPGRHTAEDIINIRKQQGDRCAYTGVKLNGKGHCDHIIPLNRGGSNWPHNLQLLSDFMNVSKADRSPIEHLKSMVKQAVGSRKKEFYRNLLAVMIKRVIEIKRLDAEAELQNEAA